MRARWVRIGCYRCGGYGVVGIGVIAAGYTSAECLTCDGVGQLWLHRSGLLARYPGGPFAAGQSRAGRRLFEQVVAARSRPQITAAPPTLEITA